MVHQETMGRTRRTRPGDSIDRICRRFYDVYDDEGTVDEALMHKVREALVAANPALADEVRPGRSMDLPRVHEFGPQTYLLSATQTPT